MTTQGKKRKENKSRNDNLQHYHEPGPYIVEDRRMISRAAGDSIRITHIIRHGRRQTGCLTCCHAPDSCPTLSCFPCFDYPEYIVKQVNASQYIYVRENSLEWNNPGMQATKGSCCGISCCGLAVKDNITVLYFDDMYFDDIRNDTRCCNSCRTFFCGGKGEEVQIESTFFCGMCKRGRLCLTCIPSCCPEICCPCLIKSEIWVEDATTAVKIMTMARDSARSRLDIT